MELKTYLNPLLKWWWLIALSTLLAGVASFLALRRQPALYQAHATLLVGRAIEDLTPSNTEFTVGQSLAQIYAEIARREPMRAAVMERLGVQALPSYTVSALPNTQLMEISVVDTSAQRAQAVANALTEELIQLSPSGLQPEDLERQAFLDDQLDKLQAQIDETDLEIEAKQSELGEAFSAQEIGDIQNEIAALETKRNTLQSNYAALLANAGQQALNTITVIEPASIPRAPVKSQLELTVLTAAALGFAMGAAAAYLLEYIDSSVRSARDIASAAGLPILGSIPRFSSKEYDSELIASTYPHSNIAESFRDLRTRLQFSASAEPHRSLLITSPAIGDGKSLLAANLAVSMARAGQSILLIDADLRYPRQDRIFGLKNKAGLSTLLTLSHTGGSNGNGESASHSLPGMRDIVQPTAEDHLQVITSGPAPSNPAELLSSTRMVKLLRALAARFDAVIIDTPALLAVTDAIILGPAADRVLVVARTGKTRKADLEAAVAKLNAVDANVIGVALNSIKRGQQGYYYNSPYTKQEARGRKKPAAARPKRDPAATPARTVGDRWARVRRMVLPGRNQ